MVQLFGAPVSHIKFQVLASPWHSPSHGSHLGSESVDGRFLSLSHPLLYHFPLKIKGRRKTLVEHVHIVIGQGRRWELDIIEHNKENQPDFQEH